MSAIENMTPNLGGRPPKYRKEFDRLAYQLALLGATDLQLAEAFEVGVNTIDLWKKTKRGFSGSLRRGKLQADARVAHGLFRRATGFKYDEVTYERIEPADGQADSQDPAKADWYRRRVVTKYVPPDTGAATLWLKNRQKEAWRDKQEIGLEFSQLSDEQVDQLFDRTIQTIQSIQK